MGSRLRLALVSGNNELSTQMELRLRSKGYQVIIFSKISAILGSIYSDPPDVMIVDMTVLDTETQKLIKEIKRDNYFSVIPVIGILGDNPEEVFDWEHYPLDDFIALPLKYTELFSRISLSLQRIQRIFDNNPLVQSFPEIPRSSRL